MTGMKPNWSDDAVRDRFLQETAGLPPEARPGSATQMRTEAIKAQTGLHGQAALRNPGTPSEGEPDSI
jgi:hypothetical protein